MAYIGKNPTSVPLTSSDLADSIVTSAKIVDGTIVGDDINTTFDLTGKTVTGAGITEADQWRIIANWSTVAPITSGWERNDTAGYGTLGTGMTESSGIFTFPSTGIWFIQFNSYADNSSATVYTRTDIEVTTNNSTYVIGAVSYGSSYTTGAYNSQCSTFIFDVTDTTTHKTRFALGQNASGTPSLQGSTTLQSSGVTFIRLGNT